MQVTVEVLGEGTQEISLEEGTYGDILGAVGLRSHEATVLVDGRPVPEDQPIEASAVTVLKLVQGG